MMGLVALIASSEQQLQSAAASGARLHSAGFATEMHVKHIQGAFLTVPSNLQYQRDARKTYTGWFFNCSSNFQYQRDE